MPFLNYRLGLGIFSFLLLPAVASWADEPEIWDTAISRTWLDDHISVSRTPRFSRLSYGLTRTQIWANGIARTDRWAFETSAGDRAIGAKLQPFQDLNVRVGTELIRNGGDAGTVASKALWEAYWSHDSQTIPGLTFNLSTTGSLSGRYANYSQAVSGTLGIPLDLSIDMWRTEIRLTPNLNFDTVAKAVSTGLTSEFVGQTVLSSPEDEFKSVLNVMVGYGFAPDARPVASAKLELKIQPNL